MLMVMSHLISHSKTLVVKSALMFLKRLTVAVCSIVQRVVLTQSKIHSLVIGCLTEQVRQVLGQPPEAWSGGQPMQQLLKLAHAGLMTYSPSLKRDLSLMSWVKKLGWRRGRVLKLKAVERR